MKTTVRQKIFLFSLVILAGNGLLGYSVFKSYQKLVDTEGWVEHTKLVIYKSSNVYVISKDMETALEGFVVTEDKSFLEPLYADQKTVFVYIGQIRKLTRDNPPQQKRIDSLEFYIRGYLAFSLKTIQIRNKQRNVAYASAKQGKIYTDHIRQVTAAIQQEENTLLIHRKQTNEHSLAVFNRFSLIMFMLMGAGTLILLITLGKYLLQNREKEKRAAELAIANKELLFQNDEKEDRAAELIVANEELLFQNEEKGKRAMELAIANEELLYQNAEKEKRAAELAIANEELFFQNCEKEKRASELNKANHLYAFISQINQNILHEKDEAGLFYNACRIAIEFGKFQSAWIGLFDALTKKVRLVDQIGISVEDIKRFKNIPLKDDDPQQYVLQNGKSYICNDILNDVELDRWKLLAEKQGICSCMILPVKKSGKIIGTFNLYATELNFFYQEEITLLEGLAYNISFALDLFEKEKTHKQTQELVIQNEKRFRALIEKSPDMITLSTVEEKLIYGSHSIVNKLGYTIEELLQMPIFDIIHPDEIPEVIKIRDEILQAPGKSVYYQQRRKHKNGSWIWCEGTLTNMLNEPGIHALVSNFRDISEKKISEQKQEFDSNNLNALINSTKDLMWSVDTNYNLITSNLPFDEMIELVFGKSIMKGDNVLPLGYPEGKLNSYKSYYERAFAGEIFTEIEYTDTPFDFWTEISLYPMRKRDEVIGTACYLRDITERKKAEQQLIDSSNSYLKALNDLNKIMDSSLDIICSIDGEGRFVSVSEASNNVWGYKPDELIGRKFIDFVFEEDVEKTLSTDLNIIDGFPVTIFENRYVHKNGSIVPMLWSANWDGKDKVIYCITKDISEKKGLEIAFESERQRFYDLFLQAPSAMGIFRGPDHIFEMVNPLCLQLIGKKDIAGKSLKDVLPEVDGQGIVKILDEVYKTGKTFSADEMLLKLDRENNGILIDTYLNFTFQAYKDVDSVFAGIFFFAINVTEQVLSRKKIEESEIRYRQIVETAEEGIWLLDENNKTTFVNKKMCELLEYEEHEILGRTNLSFKGEEGQQAGRERLKKARRGINENHDTRFITKTGRYVWAHVSTNSIFDNGVYKGLLFMVTDITKRKAIEEKLAGSESGLKKAQIMANLGNFEIDMVHYAEIWSDQMYEILGVAKEGSAGPGSFYKFIHPDDLNAAREAYASLNDSSLDYRLILKNGALRYVNSEWRFEFDKKNKPVRLYGIMQDITDRKLAEIERKKLANDMMIRNTELEQFSYIISHNLRSPVANIIGAASALNDPDLTGEDREILNRGINTSVTKLDNVVRDLNHILEIKGEINDTKEIVHFSTLAEDIKFSIKNLIDKCDIEIKYDFSEINEFLTLRAYLYSIFYNLISNSIKYRREQVHSIIEINSSLEKNKLKLVFKDNGKGIDLEKNGVDIFGLYKRFHTNIEGKGMGLYMVKTQVEALGGKISIKSAENKGTEFKIEFDL